MKNISQEKQILNWLESGMTLTGLQALDYFGCLALAQRIARLRETHDIKTTMIRTRTGKWIAEYSINK